MVWVGDIAPILVFLAIVAGIWAVLSFISNRNSKSLERLAAQPASVAVRP